MMLENQQQQQVDDGNYGYQIIDANILPAIDKLTNATSANSELKYWSPATDESNQMEFEYGNNSAATSSLSTTKGRHDPCGIFVVIINIKSKNIITRGTE
jgi:hypothetical protein